MDMNCEVTIICPIYNKERYLQATIDSVVAQTWTAWEMLLIDDGSTDHSIKIAQKAAEQHQNIHFISRNQVQNDFKGASVCRNIGIEKAKGKWILFLDADDVLRPFALKERMHVVAENPELNMMVFQEAYFYQENEAWFHKINIERLHQKSYKSAKDKTAWALKKFLKFDLPWTISNSLWATDFLKKNQGFTPHFQRLQDPEMHIRALLHPDLKWKYLKGSFSADVGIRLDPERTQQSVYERLSKQKKAVEFMIRYFRAYLKDHGHEKWMPYLNGYVFALEYDIRNQKNELSENEFQGFIAQLEILKTPLKPSFSYQFLMKTAVFLNQYPWLKKIKLPSLLYRLYYL